jgi:hypothetical protein
MALHLFVFLLVVCLLLALALLWCLDRIPLRPSSPRGEAKRNSLPRLLKPRTPDDARPVVSAPLPRRVEGQRLRRCVPGVR